MSFHEFLGKLRSINNQSEQSMKTFHFKKFINRMLLNKLSFTKIINEQ